MEPKRIINVHTHLHKNQDVDARVRLWRECNVRKVCVLCMPDYPKGTARGERPYYHNQDLLPVMDRYGDIIVGMGAVNLFEQPDGPEKVDWLTEKGFAGIKCIGAFYPYNHEIYFPIYERAEELGMPILFHTGWLASSLDGSERTIGINAENYRPYLLDKIARSFPDLRIIGAHLGKPHAEEALQMLDAYPHIYFDFSGGSGNKKHWRWILKALSPLPDADMRDPEENPALGYFEKLCFATDNPEPPVWIAASNHIMDGLCIPEDLRERFYWQNAAGIFGWTEDDLA